MVLVKSTITSTLNTVLHETLINLFNQREISAPFGLLLEDNNTARTAVERDPISCDKTKTLWCIENMPSNILYSSYNCGWNMKSVIDSRNVMQCNPSFCFYKTRKIRFNILQKKDTQWSSHAIDCAFLLATLRSGFNSQGMQMLLFAILWYNELILIGSVQFF